MTDDQDQLYARPREMIVDFRFDDQVARVFPDMIRRSVPGYDTIIPMLGVFAEHYAQPNSNIYDLGCSLGAASLAIRQGVGERACTIIAVDNSTALVFTIYFSCTIVAIRAIASFDSGTRSP